VSLLRRIPEQPIMDSPGQVSAYAAHHTGRSDAAFLMWLMMSGMDLSGAEVVDLGCGPAALPIQLCNVFDGLTITGIDPSGPMIERARVDIVAAGLSDRIAVRQAAVPWTPLHASTYDVVLSHGLLHHLADPCDLWREAIRLTHADGRLLVMDLLRPGDQADLESAVGESAATGASEQLLLDFAASLQSAYTLDEVQAQLATTGLSHLEPQPIGSRLFAVSGAVTGSAATG
jgi:ubiquinone/menaquinone biosynthesis C-methylase UbiE